MAAAVSAVMLDAAIRNLFGKAGAKAKVSKKAMAAGALALKIGQQRKKPNKKRSGNSLSSGMNTMPAANHRKVTVPASVGSQTVRRAKAPHITSVPFSTLSNVTIVGTAALGMTFQTGPLVFNSTFRISPTAYSGGPYQSNALGIGVSNIGAAYARYQIRKLKVTYVPVVGSNTSGSLVLGCTTEQSIANTGTPQQVSDSLASITTPVWKEASMDLTGILNTKANPEWFYTNADGSTDGADFREQFQVALVIAGLGASNGVSYGYLRMDGVVAYTDLSDIIGGLAEPAPKIPLTMNNAVAKALVTPPHQMACSSAGPDTPLHIELCEETPTNDKRLQTEYQAWLKAKAASGHPSGWIGSVTQLVTG